jgi:hypothetical protein
MQARMAFYLCPDRLISKSRSAAKAYAIGEKGYITLAIINIGSCLVGTINEV